MAGGLLPQLDGNKRLTLLNEHAGEEARCRIWGARYGGRDNSGDGRYDYFIKAWLDLAVLSRKTSLFGTAKKKAKTEQAARVLWLGRYQDADELTRQLLDAEYKHLFRMIIHLESTDYGFSHHVLGIGKLDDQALREKISDQFDQVLR